MNPYRIKSIHLSMVGPFQELKLVLPATLDNSKAEVHILTGENGTGKTSVLEVIGTVFLRYYSIRQVNGQKLRQGESKFEVQFASDHILSHDLLAHDISHRDFKRNVLGIHSDNSLFPSEPNFAAFAYSGYRRSETENIYGVYQINDYPLANATDFSESINPNTLVQWLVNTQTRELIAIGKNKPLEAVKHRESLSVIENAISQVTESVILFELEDDPFQAKINVDGQSLNFDQIPDGLKSIVSWLGDLLMRMDRIQWADDVPVLERPFLLLLDEIDVHLHPAWQRKILPVVQKLFPNAQVIVSTHSPFVVGSIDGAWVHKFVKKDGFSVLDGPPILSEDARSYEYILEEIFGIKERFGIEIERKLAEFQQLKKELLRHDMEFDETRFRQLVDELRGQSTELDSLLGMELKQLERLTQRSFIE